MKLVRLHLEAFGPFTNHIVEFSQPLVLVHGRNEAGKSSTLRAISDLRFGIPPQSRDNFIHAHPDMRVGGVFLDRHGREHCLMRRKGAKATLHFAEFGADAATCGEAAPAEIEALLTYGLKKEEHDAMFGLDHRRLREGGEALLKGEGEVGAALFEASAGVRSIPQILDRLDQSARKFFMPGARGRNGRINEALKAYDEHQAEYKKSLVRPALWTDLFKRHHAELDKLADLERQHSDINGRQLLVKELRAVAPLLRALDHAASALGTLQSTLLLSETAATERAAAESGLAIARHAAKTAADDAQGHRQRMQSIAADTALLDIAPAVRRLCAQAETVDRHRRDLAQAQAAVAGETAHVVREAAVISTALPVPDVLARAPASAATARLEERFRALECTRQALDQLHEQVTQAASLSAAPIIPLPAAGLRTALRIAQAETARADSVLKRLAALPLEISACRRALAAALHALGLPDEAALRQARPLLDAQIDDAMNRQNGHVTLRADHERRIAEIAVALQAESEQRDRLLAQGAVATYDTVAQARARRDQGWQLVRGVYIDGAHPGTHPDTHLDMQPFAQSTPLPAAYEETVAQADRLADEFARDTNRAAELQSRLRAIAGLERDRSELLRKIEQGSREEAAQQTEWRSMLAASGLPALSPEALRDWQALLPPARRACETLQARLDEQAEAEGVRHGLASALREAIVGTGIDVPAPDAAIATLAAMADDITARIVALEKAIDVAAGQETERRQRRAQLSTQEAGLTRELQEARDALAPALESLLLDSSASVAVARARLGEFNRLLAARDRLASAEKTAADALVALNVLEADAGEIAARLSESRPPELRLYIDRLAGRLALAEQADAERRLAQQALDTALANQRQQEQAADRHAAILASLCRAAGVDSSAMLPDAEERSKRKRDAQAELDRSSLQIAQSSPRHIPELRALLNERDPASIEAEEQECAQLLAQSQDELAAARIREESARRALEAIDSTDTAAAAREAMERAVSCVRATMPQWVRSRLAHALLAQSLKQ